MSNTPHRRRRRLPLEQVAAFTAGALGIALLTTPGVSSAQTEIDCVALGEHPIGNSIEETFEIAETCDVEAAFPRRYGQYSSLYATPDRQLHLVSTAGPEQTPSPDLTSDPTLIERDEGLTPASVKYPLLRYTDESLALFEDPTATVDWVGAIPVPTYSGTTARYEGLATGLDLTVDVDIASAGLVFTVDDGAAWSALSGGLTVTTEEQLSIVDGAIHVDHHWESDGLSEWTTPFTVRAADGSVTPVTLEIGTGGALTLSLPDGYLETAAFPLELSTVWAWRSNRVNGWGSVTSAAPDLAVFKGEAGLSSPYFEAAGRSGDAIAGAYCDTLVEPECAATHEAASYWSFQWPSVDGIRPSLFYEYTHSVVDAAFQVDAAAGTECSVPELHLTEEYSPAAVWSNRPASNGTATAGECQDGTATYDVTDTVNGAWGDTETAGPLTFGMTESSPPASFDGGSARLDVYFDIYGFKLQPDWDDCGYSESSPVATYDTTPDYGGFVADAWPETDEFDFTWTATFYDEGTGETILTTEERETVRGANPRFSLDEGAALDEGAYRIVYEFKSNSSDYVYRSDHCHIRVDTTDPELLVTGQVVAVVPGGAV